MSWALTKWVRDSVDIRPAARKMVLLILATYASEEGDAWMGVQEIIDNTGLSERAVAGHLNALEEIGLITRRRQYARGLIRKNDVFSINEQWQPDGQQALFDDLPKQRPARKASAKPGNRAVPANSAGTVTRKKQHSYPQESTKLPANSAGSNKDSNKKGQRKNSARASPRLPEIDQDINGLIDGKYWVKLEIIRLEKKDFKAFEQLYPALDLDAELERYDRYLAEKGGPGVRENWFLRTKRHLANREAEEQARLALLDEF